MQRLLVLLLIALATASCGPPDEPLPEARTEIPWHEATSRAGRYRVRWRPADGPIPLNAPFELDVEAFDAASGSPVTGATIGVVADMPEHGHGMLREPRSEELGEGRYRVRGMLMHMSGHWTLSIDVIAGGIAEAADFEVQVE